MDTQKLTWILLAGWLSIVTMIMLCYVLNKVQLDQMEQNIERHCRRASYVYDHFIENTPQKQRRRK